MLMVPELMAFLQALAAAAMLVPVYFVTPSTLPVQVLPREGDFAGGGQRGRFGKGEQ